MVEQWKTDDLMADLSEQRDKLNSVMDDYSAAFPAYDLVKGDLALMQSKITFLGKLMRRTMDIVVPDTSDVETDAQDIIFSDFSKVGQAKNILWLSTAPLVTVMIMEGLTYVGVASKTGRVARMAKAGKAWKLVRFGKIAGPAAMAVELGMFIWNEALAKKNNEEMREAIKELKAARVKAKKELEKLKAYTRGAEEHRKQLLKEAGVKTVDEFVNKLGGAFVEVGAMREKLIIGRNMLIQNRITPDLFSTEMIMNIMGADDKNLVLRIEARLNAEYLFAEGSTRDQVAEATGLPEETTAEIQMTVDARDAYVRGMSESAILETIGVPSGTYEEIEETIDLALDKAWSDVESDAPLQPLANKLILRVAALEDLRLELRAKTRLAQHEDIGTISEALAKERGTIAQWASALPLQKEEARFLASEANLSQQEIAAECRLPMAMLAQIA